MRSQCFFLFSFLRLRAKSLNCSLVFGSPLSMSSIASVAILESENSLEKAFFRQLDFTKGIKVLNISSILFVYMIKVIRSFSDGAFLEAVFESFSSSTFKEHPLRAAPHS